MSGIAAASVSRGTHIGFCVLIGWLCAALVLAAPPTGDHAVYLSASGVLASREDGHLRVAVIVSPPKGGAMKRVRGMVQVELLDDHGEVVTGDRALGGLEQAAVAVPLSLEIDEAPAGARLRCRFRNDTIALNDVVTVPLTRALLRIPHETTLAVGDELHADSDAYIHCEVHGVRSMTETVPLPAAAVTARLRDNSGKEHLLARGHADDHGTCDLRFHVPDVAPGPARLEVTTTSAFDEQRLVRNIQVPAEGKLLLVSDRPQYQPGQRMHLRALVLKPSSLRPVQGGKVMFQIADGNGNKVLQEEVLTSAHGIATIDFDLADEVNTGDYTLRAAIANEAAVRTVSVRPYALPKFKAEVVTDRKFYRPGEVLRGDLQADYFFGKPVAGAKVRVAAQWEESGERFFTWEGTADTFGHARWEVRVPALPAKLERLRGTNVRLEATVTDTAGHREVVERTCAVSSQPIHLGLIAEGGQLVPGLENRLFVLTNSPDGSPASCDVEIWAGWKANGRPLAVVHTDETGVGELLFTPQLEQLTSQRQQLASLENLLVGRGNVLLTIPLTAKVRDRRGEQVEQTFELQHAPIGENVLLRLDRAIYRSGDKMAVQVLSTGGMAAAQLDIVQDGQLIATRELTLKDGAALESVELPANCLGPVEVYVSQPLEGGEWTYDSRVIYVHPARELKIAVRPDRDSYRPGAEGTIHFEVTDWNGRPTAAALGVLIVDEAVFAIHDVQPGMEKAHFTLRPGLERAAAAGLEQEEVRPPGHLEDVVRSPEHSGDTAAERRKQSLARALLATASPKFTPVGKTAPALLRRSQLQAQVRKVGEAVLNHALDGEPFQIAGPKGGWVLRPRLLGELVRDGELLAGDLTLPSGEVLTLARLARLEPGFTAERLAHAVTAYRARRLVSLLVAEAEKNAELKKDGRWTLPAGALEMALKAEPHLENHRDAWGHLFRLVRLKAPRAEKCGVEQLEDDDLQSAGPDGVFGTEDDISFTARTGWLLDYWWQSDAALKAKWAALCNPAHRDHSRLMASAGPYMRGERLQQQEMWAGLGGLAGVGGLGGFGGGGFGGGGFGGLGVAGLAGIGGGFHMLGVQGGFMGNFQGNVNLGVGGGIRGLRGNPLDENMRPAQPGTVQEHSYQAPRVRRYFPETLLWRPEVITDEHGKASLPVHFADSITTWRLAATGSSIDGGLGSTTAPLRVFQDFFVDIDLPPQLTRNDEISVPVVVYNYLKEPQTVKLALQLSPWFELLDAADGARSISLRPQEVISTAYRLRAKQVGRFNLTVEARGTKVSDAVRRSIDVVPDGRKVEQSKSGRLAGKMQLAFDLPPSAIRGSARLLVKVHPGIISQVVEGLESMLQVPHGCFEQTSSTVYPNLLVLDYLNRTDGGTPEVRARARELLRLGYQRLLTFECKENGFDLYGHGPPVLWLTALALHEFSDMARVFPVDPEVIRRTRHYLTQRQEHDGSWRNSPLDELPLTCYIAWVLAQSDPRAPEVIKALEYVRKRVDWLDNGYDRALAANALAASDPKDPVIGRLFTQLEADREDSADRQACKFVSKRPSFAGPVGEDRSIETTALTVLAILRTGGHEGTVTRALAHLVRAREAGGGWGTTQATVLALKALAAAAGGAKERGAAHFTIVVNGKEVASGEINGKTADLLQQFDLTEHLLPGRNEVTVRADDKTGSLAQIVARHHEPWDKRAERSGDLDLQVAYDRTRLSVKDTVHATATLRHTGLRTAPMVMVELGLPPGFVLDENELTEMVRTRQIEKYQLLQGRIVLYLDAIRPGTIEKFAYTLRPKSPAKVQAPTSSAYEYYTPSRRVDTAPVELVVEAAR
jgi:hypothetical protein